MADLTNSPNPGRAKNDPAGFGKDVLKYGLTFGTAGAAALAGWNWVAKPGYNAINQGASAISEAANEAGQSTGDIGVDFS